MIHDLISGKYGFDAFTHRRTVVNIPSWFEYILGFRYPPYDKKHISKVTVSNPPFKKGERLEDQTVGPSVADRVKTLGGVGAKWAFLAVTLAMVDARMGGRPKLLEVLGTLSGGLRSRLPL